MNIEEELRIDGIFVTEKIDTQTVLNITKNISEKIVNTFPNFDLSKDEIFSKLCSLNMYKAEIPESTLEASYCYKNSSIYFDANIQNEDLEEFAIHECIHFLQEVKDKKNNLKRLGLSIYNKEEIKSRALNEAAVQFLSSKIIGIKPSFEKYYNIELFTPSPSYYPVECALLNELVYFLGTDVLFKSTFFSTDEFKNTIINLTSKAVYKNIEKAFDIILACEEQLIKLNCELENTIYVSDIESEISKTREKIQYTFINTQNLIITAFFNSRFKNLSNLDLIDNFKQALNGFKNIICTIDNYTFFDNYYLETINKLEHLSNILQYGEKETYLKPTTRFSFFRILKKLKDFLFSKRSET